MKIIAIVFIAIAATLALGSCSEPVPVERIFWQPDGEGNVQFKTNDEQDYNTPFIHIPATPGNVLTGNADWTAQADVIQMAGTTIGGHGLVVGYDGLTAPTLNCVILLVNCIREYKIIKRESGIFSTVKDWTSSSDLNIYLQVNSLQADYDNANSRLTFSANGHQLFQMNGYAIGKDTQAGFVNAIMDYQHEGFPKHYSDRRFKLTQPVAYP